jgi:phosphoserine phosphatase RsbX
MERVSKSRVELGVACATLAGQSESGDRYVCETFDDGVLLALVDGIGHGPEAAVAAKTACAILETHAAEPVIALAERCHRGLRFTRGVVMGLAAFDLKHNLLTWLGIGNVQGVVRRFGLPEGTEELLLLRAGVVGSQLPPLQASVFPIAPRDMIVLATDGVKNGFGQGIPSCETALGTAQAILDHYNKQTDDALVLVVRY